MDRCQDTEPENMLRGMVLLAASFCEASALLILTGEQKYPRAIESAGLSPEQRLALEACVSEDPELLDAGRLEETASLQVLRRLMVLSDEQRPMGSLWILGSEALELSAPQIRGLECLVGQIQAIVSLKQSLHERRTIHRGPSGSSFVPGLVHELRNFIFGFSGSLDTFELRFQEQPEAARYGEVLRNSLNGLKAFTEELREYGDPSLLSLEEASLEPLLREVLEHHRTVAQNRQVELRLEMASPPPYLRMDLRSLQSAFIHVVALVLDQEDAQGRVIIHAMPHRVGEQKSVSGYVDGSSLNLKNLDLARLFEPFYYRASGLGRLGLPAARRIFEAHGGSLNAASSPTGGLRMDFMLPTL